eukprot:364737-Chlamydomonas_euryale.AAC.1
MGARFDAPGLRASCEDVATTACRCPDGLPGRSARGRTGLARAASSTDAASAASSCARSSSSSDGAATTARAPA